MGYDTSKETTGADVAREFGEFAGSVKALRGEGTLAQVEKEAVEVAQAAADLIRDSVVGVIDKTKRYFRTTLGYQLHDPEQDVHVLPHKDTPAEVTSWVEDRLADGMLKETTADVHDGTPE